MPTSDYARLCKACESRPRYGKTHLCKSCLEARAGFAIDDEEDERHREQMAARFLPKRSAAYEAALAKGAFAD